MSELASKIFEQALTAVRAKDHKRALALLVEVLKLKPNFYEAWIVRGNILHSNDWHFESLLHYDRALQINDQIHDGWNNRGLACADLGLFAMAEESFNRSLELLPAVEPHMGLANMYCTRMELEKAAEHYGAAVQMNPAMMDARFNLGVTLLGLGRWQEGFEEYAYRLENSPYPPRVYRDYKRWQGEDLTDKTIVLYPEQGYGDEIMALRFAQHVAVRTECKVIVLARGPMLRLAKSIATPFENITVEGMNDWYGKADYSCALLDVPAVLGLDHTKVSQDGYLLAPGGDWWPRLEKLPPGLKVGLCWSSGTHMNTARAAHLAKSIPLQHLSFLKTPGVNFISLQKPREVNLDGTGIIDWTDDIHDFGDTAGLISYLDLVISVDTAVAHLAGALGVECWNFVRFSGYWPWVSPEVLKDKHHSIWYPNMKLLRQPGLNDWREPLALASEWLQERVGQEKAA